MESQKHEKVESKFIRIGSSLEEMMIKIFLVFCVLSTTLFAKPTVIVGIAGGTGSGKTTLAEKVHQAFSGSVLLSQDSYYRDLSHLSMEERGKNNFDHPDSLEFSLLRQHLIALKKGLAIECPIYNFHVHSREKRTERVEPAQIIFVEGILLLAAPEVRDLLDIKIFVDTDSDVRVIRRIERDVNERSRDFNSIKEQYLTTVKPMHEAFVEPSKRYADVIVPEGGHNQVAIDLIVAKLRE
jgi:uridine kinase